MLFQLLRYLTGRPFCRLWPSVNERGKGPIELRRVQLCFVLDLRQRNMTRVSQKILDTKPPRLQAYFASMKKIDHHQVQTRERQWMLYLCRLIVPSRERESESIRWIKVSLSVMQWSERDPKHGYIWMQCQSSVTYAIIVHVKLTILQLDTLSATTTNYWNWKHPDLWSRTHVSYSFIKKEISYIRHMNE